MTRTVVMEGSFENLLKRAKTGDVIALCQVPYNDWCAHSDGVNIMRIARNNKFRKIFRINGIKPFTGTWNNYGRPFVPPVYSKAIPSDWQKHPKGIMWTTKSGILLNGKTLIYRGKVDEIKYSPYGALCRLGNKFFLVVSKS